MENYESQNIMSVTMTDTTTMEYCPLPVIDLSYRFIYRFLTPVATCWDVEGRISHTDLVLSGKDLNENLKEFAVKKFKEMVVGDSNDPVPEELQWLLKADKAEIHLCDIVRKV